MAEQRESTFQPVCLIVGAGPGLGAAIAERYATEGFVAYLLSRNPDRLSPVVDPMIAKGLQVVRVRCDLRSEESLSEALDFIRRNAGRCDVIVYNAFANSEQLGTQLSAEELLDDFKVNVASALSIVRMTVRPIESGRPGTILFSGCGLAGFPSAHRTSLSVGKAGLRALVECLAEELEPRGIRVGMVTIDGTLSGDVGELASIADLYWQLFVHGSEAARREARWPE
jgi:NAD(P)-dependent dehydrogenase (short-subunit alcohol dehydrogenase family)